MITFPVLLTFLMLYFIAPSLAIINGDEVEPHSRPYMVAIKTNINNREVLCGGSLLSDSFVLTAATCVYGATEVEVIVGAHNIEDDTEKEQLTVTSSDFIIHEEFNNKNYHNDIALILLRTAVTLSDNIKTIQLPNVSDVFTTYDDQLGSVAGWGKISDNTTETSKVLREQNFTIIPVLTCEISYLLQLSGSQMCTSGVSKNNICRGDAGSPLVVDGVQVGIASYGSIYGCSIGFPGVYTRITSYLSWLLLTIS